MISYDLQIKRIKKKYDLVLDWLILGFDLTWLTLGTCNLCAYKVIFMGEMLDTIFLLMLEFKLILELLTKKGKNALIFVKKKKTHWKAFLIIDVGYYLFIFFL